MIYLKVLYIFGSIFIYLLCHLIYSSIIYMLNIYKISIWYIDENK